MRLWIRKDIWLRQTRKVNGLAKYTSSGRSLQLQVSHWLPYSRYLFPASYTDSSIWNFIFFTLQNLCEFNRINNTEILWHKRYFPRSLPWNEDNLFGYIVETCFIEIVGLAYFFTNGAVLLLFISLTWILQAFSKMYRHTTNKFKQPPEDRNDEKTLCELINFQNMAREWVKRWNSNLCLFINEVLKPCVYFFKGFSCNWWRLSTHWLWSRLFPTCFS